MEPPCLEGCCLVGFDQLTDEDFRLLEIRWVLVHLGELGLGQIVAREYGLDRRDLCELAMIEAECRALAAEKDKGEGKGHGEEPRVQD